jgi:hypothetical protein
MTDMPTVEECEIATGSYDFYVGSGWDRHGYHIPGSRWIYKVAKDPNNDVNQGEYSRYQELQEQFLPDGIAIPEMHLLENGIIAAEFIDGEKPHEYCRDHDSHYEDYPACWLNWVNEFSGQTGLWDSSALCNMRLIRDEAGNVTKVYLIDLGE